MTLVITNRWCQNAWFTCVGGVAIISLFGFLNDRLLSNINVHSLPVMAKLDSLCTHVHSSFHGPRIHSKSSCIVHSLHEINHHYMGSDLLSRTFSIKVNVMLGGEGGGIGNPGDSDIEFCNKSGSGPWAMQKILTSNIFCVRIHIVCSSSPPPPCMSWTGALKYIVCDKA